MVFYGSLQGPAREPPKNTRVERVTPYLNKERLFCVNEQREARIKKEHDRLLKIFDDIPKKEKAIIDGLIKRAAYMRIALEDMEKDLDENGYVESFTQSEKTAPYERERPVARLYNSMNKNYQSTIKQLTDRLPAGKGPAATRDTLDKFLDSE